MNKRADIAITILVVLVLFLTGITLFSFLKSPGKIEEKIINVKFMNSFQLKQQTAEFYLEQAGKNAFVKTYEQFAKGTNQYDFIANRKSNNYFGELHPKLKENFIEKFRENFKKEISGYLIDDSFSFTSEILEKTKQLVKEDKFSLAFEGEILELKSSELIIEDSSPNAEVLFIPKISLEFDYEKLGLHSFEKIYRMREYCLSLEGNPEILNSLVREECLREGLLNFEIGVNEESLVNLKTEEEFYLDGGFKRIEFSFVL